MLSVRKVEPPDYPLLDAAAKADFYHAAAGLTGEHWANPNSLLYSDEQGPVVALKTTSVARVDIQFISRDVQRNAVALATGFGAYIALLIKRGIEEVIFTSNSKQVINFFVNRFHFRNVGGNTFSLRIKE